MIQVTGRRPSVAAGMAALALAAGLPPAEVPHIDAPPQEHAPRQGKRRPRRTAQAKEEPRPPRHGGRVAQEEPMTKHTGPDDFWRFFALREQARRAKERRAPLEDGSYSADPILARYHFCNVFREADSGTRYFQQFRAKRGADGLTALEAVLWQACLYRPVNRVSTFEAFRAQSATNSPFVPCGEAGRWLRWLDVRFNRGERVFTGRHLNRGMACYKALVRHLEARAGAGLKELAAAIVAAEPQFHGLRPVVKALMTVPNVGAFFGWQIACDLVESRLVADDPTWAQLGPGAVRGAALVYAGMTAEDEGDACAPDGRPPLAVAKWLVETQAKYVPLFVRSDWWRWPVTLKDVEHALCEYVRYVQARDGNPQLEVKPWAKSGR